MRRRRDRREAPGCGATFRRVGAGAAGAGGRRGPGRGGRAACRGHVDRQRRAAATLAGAEFSHPHAGPDAPFRSGHGPGRAAPAGASHGGGSGSKRRAAGRPPPAACRRAGIDCRARAGRPSGRGRDSHPEAGSRFAPEADDAAVESTRPATDGARALGIVRAAVRTHAVVRARRGPADDAPMEAPRLAAEVQKLRAEWKALDQQHAGVPKALWERFDRACETAYAPAARYFTELAAQRKDARKRRDAFIEAAAAQAAPSSRSPATGARSSIGCVSRIALGATAISAVSNKRPGQRSTPATGRRWRRCAMPWRRRGSKPRRDGGR